jgi:carboxyl-terminal processing protease
MPGRVIIILFFLCATCTAEQQSEKLPLDQRVWIASKIYSAVQLYFAHYEAVPDLDLDKVYKDYLRQAIATDDRKAFDLASLEFFAHLKNGHSTFNDKWLRESYGQPLGFLLLPAENKWVVARSRIDGLAVGDVVQSIDGVSVQDFFQQKSRYLAASNLAEQQKRLFYSAFLFPDTFTLALENGKQIEIRRSTQKLQEAPSNTQEGRILENNIVYLRIPSFEKLEDENKAVQFVKEHADAKSFIVDVRGNGGGSTPSRLIRTLMNRPFRDINEATPMPIGVFGAYQQVVQSMPREQFTDADHAVLEALGSLSRPMFLMPGALRKPENPIYNGKLIILIDDFCASACEDFVIPFKSNGRAKLIGRPTEGSTGQPYMYDFGNGISFRISSKRIYFPDGSQFEGVGVEPDIEIPLSIKDLRANKDTALEKAITLAREN